MCAEVESACALDLLPLGNAQRADLGVRRQIEVVALKDFGGIAAQPTTIDQPEPA
jgi:hypothetical protein